MRAGLKSTTIFLIAQLLLGAGLIWWSQHNPFFWDTVQLASKHAHFFYHHELVWQPLPIEIDSGHPPLLGYYLAWCWHWFGKSLEVSHWAMAPFVGINIYWLWRIGLTIGGSFGAGYLPLLALADPVFSTQHSLVSPDILVVTGFLTAVHGALRQRQWLLTIGIIILCIVSMRGMMTAAAIGLWQLFFNRKQLLHGRGWAKLAMPYLPGLILAGWFLAWHWQHSGWIGHHPDSPWAGAFKIVDWKGFLRNSAVVAWRWLDFGRVGLWLAAAWVIWKNVTSLQNWHPERQSLLVLWLALLLTLTPSALLYQNLSAHRYFLPAYLAGGWLFLELIRHAKWKHRVLQVVLLLLISGHWWIYPAGISNDWDCTLASRPFFDCQREVRHYLDSQQIDYSKVGSSFPDLNTGVHLFLSEDQRIFSAMKSQNLEWVIASNVFNDLQRPELDVLNQTWPLVWHKQSGVVWMRLYQHPAYKQQ